MMADIYTCHIRGCGWSQGTGPLHRGWEAGQDREQEWLVDYNSVAIGGIHVEADIMVVVGFLAGIMRRFSKELAASAAAGVEDSGDLSASDAAQEGEGNEAAAVGETHESRRERKRKEQMEIQAILEEEGVLDELEGKQVGVTIQAVNMSLDCDCSATGG
jgi:hypothetical protein